MKPSPNHRAARYYADKFRWHVFPTKPGTKAPHGRLVRHGHKDATTDLHQIDLWWKAEPDAGVALSCAMSGLVVIDIDRYKPECDFGGLEAKLGALPATVRQLSPQGGEHHLFRDEGIVGFRHPCAGAESKHDGYILLARSIHPNGKPYVWDIGAHPTDTAIARLPDAWLRHLTAPAKAAALPSSGIDALDSWLGRAFEAAGWLGNPLPDGKRMACCPWLYEHSDGRGDGRDSSTVLFPRSIGKTLGGFRCAHEHCKDRTWRDVVAALPAEAKWVADRAMRAERDRLRRAV